MGVGAAVEFDAILQRHPGDAVAANNAAVAKMYSVDLTGAVTALESCLQVGCMPFSDISIVNQPSLLALKLSFS